MLFSAVFLAFAGIAAAAPACNSRPPPLSTTGGTQPAKDEFNPKTGAYIDNGFGTIMVPEGGDTVALATLTDTKEGSEVQLVASFAAGTWGGRWDMREGRTLIENKEAKVTGYCMTATKDYCGVEMTKCDKKQGNLNQVWETDGTTVRLADTTFCLAVNGNLTATTRDAPITTAIVSLENCQKGKKSQTFHMSAFGTKGTR